MQISKILSSKRPIFSFEFFPPKDEAGVQALLQAVAALNDLKPDFVSVTYGAGGSARARTLSVTKAIQQASNLMVMAHITCIQTSGSDLLDTLSSLRVAGIDNVLALRGDRPATERESGGDEFEHASDLMRFISNRFDFCIGGACYPEMHPESLDLSADLNALRQKVDAGAEFLITQLFFDNERYFSFVEAARQARIDVPIVPGIMPITSTEQIRRFTQLCGASIPEPLLQELELRRGQPEAVIDLGVAYATLQCVDLLAGGAPGIHFYTLNKSPATRAVLSALLAAKSWERPAGRRYVEQIDALFSSNPTHTGA